ncbi:MAG TPA: DUF1254 domain-containing protein [Polyangia bacterium]|nr:DUF1254 domain-containing protein [Polyangia bacterium]
MLDAQSSSIGEAVSPLEAEAIAASAYIFGFPLVLLDSVHTAVAKATANAGFARAAPAQPAPTREEPAVSVLCLDLGPANVVLHVPGGAMQIRDAWSNVIASFGALGPAGGARLFGLIGPRWRGQLPVSLERIAAPTDLVCVVVPAGTDAAAPLGAGVSSSALDGAAERVSRMGAGTFLSRLARLMRRNPPTVDDEPLLARLRRIGIAPGEPTRLACLPGELKPALVSGVAAARAALASRAWAVRSPQNDPSPGARRTDYLRRALSASFDFFGAASGQAGVS